MATLTVNSALKERNHQLRKLINNSPAVLGFTGVLHSRESNPIEGPEILSDSLGSNLKEIIITAADKLYECRKKKIQY